MAISWDAVDVLTLDDLFEREDEILDRLRQTPNGERLFMLDPLRSLADAGVQLGEATMATLLRMHPNLASVSPTPYEALKASPVPQPGPFQLGGLFRRDEP